jgi:hypothetical protein
MTDFTDNCQKFLNYVITQCQTGEETLCDNINKLGDNITANAKLLYHNGVIIKIKLVKKRDKSRIYRFLTDCLD